jgi:hypothetical protein
MKHSFRTYAWSSGAAVVAVLGVLALSGTILQTARPVEIIVPENPSGRSLYVALDGKPYNDGTKERPYDIETVFRNSTIAQPGDVVWLRGGTYKVAITSELVGKPDAPIVVRQYPGERAILDAASRTESALTVRGSDAWYWGFEVTDSTTERIAKTPTYTTGLRATSVSVFGRRTRFINMVVHDGEQGFGFWSAAENSELYGNLIYNVGFEAGDRGHGHSIYVQNADGQKRIVDNIFFNGHSFGLHAYTEKGFIDNLHIEGNTAFNHGVLSHSGPTVNFLLRSKNLAPQNPVLISNYGYFSESYPGRVAEIYSPVEQKGCVNLVLTDNYFAAPSGRAVAIGCQSIKALRDNTFYGSQLGVAPIYRANTFHERRPGGVEVFIRPNRYERGRANITIFNWNNQKTVDVDLSSAGLNHGEDFEIRDAQNFLGEPVVTGVFSSRRIAIPMTALTVARPHGTVSVPPVHTGLEFGVFVVRRKEHAQ